jgi:hypothetical protein
MSKIKMLGTDMIKTLLANYNRSDRDINTLTYVLIAFLLAVAGRGAVFIYDCQYQELWPLLSQAIPLLSVLVVVRVANRLISNGHILKEDDRRQELMRTTHHLIAITKDLKARVGYAKHMLSKGGRPDFAFVQIAKSIEERYESLLQRDGFRFLPGPCVDIIVRISGNIFGIGLVAEGMKLSNSEQHVRVLDPILANGSSLPLHKLDELISDLQQLLDHLFELRLSIEDSKGKE